MNAGTPYASASLYVGDLHPEVTEALLCDIFNAVGPVASIRVCRDAVTRRSLGYAYVNFHMMVDAERSLDTMNYTMIKGRPIRIMWSHRDPSIRKSGKGNIFIKNLDKAIDNKMLYDTFCTFGNILSCKIAYDDQGRSKGYGFVHYETEEAAETAIEKVDGKMLKDKIVYVGKFKRKAEREEDVTSEKKYTNIFVKNLDESVTEDDMKEQFGGFGEITSLALMSNEEGKSKGFAFINFQDMETAKKAVEEKNGHEFKGKVMFVGRAQKKSERMAELKEKFDKIKQERINKYQGVNLYVKNLDESLDDETFTKAFEQYGQITSCRVMRDDKGSGKGFGFVCYATPEEATKAVTEMNGKILATKPIYVALAQRREQRRAQLEAQMAQRVQQSRISLACLACILTLLKVQLCSTQCRLAGVARCITSLRWAMCHVVFLRARAVSSSRTTTQVDTWSRVALKARGSLVRTSARLVAVAAHSQGARARLVAAAVARVVLLSREAVVASRLSSKELPATCLRLLHQPHRLFPLSHNLQQWWSQTSRLSSQQCHLSSKR